MRSDGPSLPRPACAGAQGTGRVSKSKGGSFLLQARRTAASRPKAARHQGRTKRGAPRDSVQGGEKRGDLVRWEDATAPGKRMPAYEGEGETRK